MDLPELKQGLNNIDNAAPAVAAADGYLTLDNLMRDYGPWFGNNAALGETLLGELRAQGVDTQAATEAMLREVLTGLVNDWQTLGQNLQTFQQMIAEQTQQAQAVTDAVSNALAKTGGPAPDMTLPPVDMPLDMSVPAPDSGTAAPPVDTVPPTEVPLAEGNTPNGEPQAEPPVDASPQPTGPSGAAPSIAKDPTAPGAVLSDARKKSIISALVKSAPAKSAPAKNVPANNSRLLDGNIISACSRGFA